ncbi:MAG: alpha/beta hydrolase [Methanomassiliicoccales archaeon]|nr:alpha/beta hydrolase [Methanomassiliicoccales archaeon]
MNLLWLALVPLLVIGVLVLASATVLAINRRRIPPPCGFVETGRGSLHYCEKGQGPPVVMLHGSNGSLQDFRLSVMDSLSDEFRVMALDRPGHGHSPRPEGDHGTCAWHGEAAREAWTKLGMKRPIVVGHSSAAAVVMDLAVRSPQDISAAVLLSGVVHSFEGGDVPVMGLYKLLKRRYLGTFLLWTLFLPFGSLLGGWLLKFTFAPDQVPPEYRRQGIALALRPGPLRAEADDLECLAPTLRAIEDRYSEVRVPLIMLVGAEDRNVPPQGQSVRLRSEVAGSELELLEKTGHMPMFTQPEAVLRAVRRAKELAADRGTAQA